MDTVGEIPNTSGLSGENYSTLFRWVSEKPTQAFGLPLPSAHESLPIFWTIWDLKNTIPLWSLIISGRRKREITTPSLPTCRTALLLSPRNDGDQKNWASHCHQPTRRTVTIGSWCLIFMSRFQILGCCFLLLLRQWFPSEDTTFIYLFTYFTV